MQSTEPRHIRTGGDPRSFPDFTALRDEMSKLTHPARPDVNWQYVEKRCLSLFEHNGVELQTAAWYALARCHIAGLPGLNEGLSLLEALITRQWGNLWPQSVHARMEILSSLTRRLQQVQRTQTLVYTDLSALYQAEKSVTGMTETLQRLELKHQSGLDMLSQWLHGAAVRLENSASPLPGTVSDVLPGKIHRPRDDDEPPSHRWVYVMPPVPSPLGSEGPVRAGKTWKPFVAGMLTALLTGGLLGWGHNILTVRPQQDALMASVTPPPATLSEEAQLTLRQKNPPWLRENKQWMTLMQQQLERLAAMPPEWPLSYGTALVRQAQVLWPDQPATSALATQWQQLRDAQALVPDALDGWHQGMVQLAQLTQSLNGLDGQKGKYLTVSELKSRVFAITQAFARTVPLEEQLRQLSTTDAAGRGALQAETAQHLRRLQAGYAQRVAEYGTQNNRYAGGEHDE
ncbi:VasL domain-containing protein [Enterobacter cloacae]|uniref:VasL domain-containing protein n=1 Tax=Enterobacter cloacae TaxID=550 RepID=UPI00188A01AB|nr:VasL domain-containing protein [Enterobacter cloacae]MBF4114204.1 type VI secretion system ImpA family N-terminal domain-containing protein [Enterobacter cloacae]